MNDTRGQAVTRRTWEQWGQEQVTTLNHEQNTKATEKLNTEERKTFGDILQEKKNHDNIQIGFINIQYLPKYWKGKKNFNLTKLFIDWNFDRMSIAETIRIWTELPDDKRLINWLRGHFMHKQIDTNNG